MNNYYSTMLYYDCLAEFEQQYFKELLTTANIVEHEKHVKALQEKGTDQPYEIDEFMTVLKKDNKQYLMASKEREKLPIKVVGVPDKYSLKSEVYHVLDGSNIASAKFKAERTMSFKELVDRLSSLEKSNDKHNKLLIMIALASMMDRLNVRISTPAGFGKDSIVDVMGHLFGAAHTVENPTIAKLEMMTYAKWLAVNEVVDITPAEWRNIEQFLLSTGAFKNKVTKRSRAHGNVGEILDTSKLSLSLFYNDIDHYPINSKYFDDVTKKAVKDRFLPLRLYGKFTEDFNSISNVNVDGFVKEHIEEYVSLIRSFNYYKANMNGELHNYPIPPMGDLSKRWITNLGRILKVIDMYSETLEEYNFWTGTLFSCMEDYKAMLEYPKMLRLLADKLKMPKDEFKERPTMRTIINYLENKQRVIQDNKYDMFIQYCNKIHKEDTFINKNLLIELFDPLKGKALRDDW